MHIFCVVFSEQVGGPNILDLACVGNKLDILYLKMFSVKLGTFQSVLLPQLPQCYFLIVTT